jgi:hypothetical protein
MANGPRILHEETEGRVRQVAVPAAARALSTLSHIDYEDAFLVDVGPTQERTAEQWARAIVEDAPVTVRRALLSGWSAIGLKLGPTRSDRFLLGWEVGCSTPDVVLLGADSGIGMRGQLLFMRHEDALLFATFVQQDNDTARAVWARIEPAHRPMVRNILEHASRQYRP